MKRLLSRAAGLAAVVAFASSGMWTAHAGTSWGFGCGGAYTGGGDSCTILVPSGVTLMTVHADAGPGEIIAPLQIGATVQASVNGSPVCSSTGLGAVSCTGIVGVFPGELVTCSVSGLWGGLGADGDYECQTE